MFDNIIIALISAIVFSAFFSGMEIAFISANRLKIELDKKNRKLAGIIISNFTKNSSSFISAMLIGNTISLVIYGMAMSHLLEPFIVKHLPEHLQSKMLIMIIQTIISTLLILFVAEFTPKLLFRIAPNALLNFFAFPLFLVFYLLFPIHFIFVKLSEFILKFFFRVNLKKEAVNFNYTDLNNFLKEYKTEEKTGEAIFDEIQMFQNAIEFRNTRIRECMVPRNEIVALEEKESVNDLIVKHVTSGHSKIIIYRDTIDNIIGYTHSFDIFSKPESIKSIIKPILYVPETMLAKDVMPMLLQQHKSIAVVVDEFGGTSGIVTLEDLLEEIVGEIDDEFDKTSPTEKQTDENTFVFSGRLEIDYLNNKYNLNIPESNDYETLAGYIIQNLGRIPEEKEQFTLHHFNITILKANYKRIEQVMVVRTTDE